MCMYESIKINGVHFDGSLGCHASGQWLQAFASKPNNALDYFSQPITSHSHLEDRNEVNLRKVAQPSGFVNRPLQVLRAGSQFVPVYARPL